MTTIRFGTSNRISLAEIASRKSGWLGQVFQPVQALKVLLNNAQKVTDFYMGDGKIYY